MVDREVGRPAEAKVVHILSQPPSDVEQKADSIARTSARRGPLDTSDRLALMPQLGRFRDERRSCIGAEREASAAAKVRHERAHHER